MADCFWTDLVNAKQVCGGDSPPEPTGLTDVLIFMSDLFGVSYLNEWEWRESSQYTPELPMPAEAQWVPAFGPNASLGSTVRNVVYIGGVNIGSGDFYIDPQEGTYGTHGTTIPSLNTTGGSGAFTATGFYFDDLDIDAVGLYDQLPPELRYPDIASRCFRIPVRRGGMELRAQYEMVSLSGGPPGFTTFDVAGVAGNGWPFYSANAIPSSFSEMDGPRTVERYYDLTPWGSSSLTGLLARALELTWRPTNNQPVTMECHIQPELLVPAPGHIDAYISDLTWYELEEPPAPYQIPEGPGQAVPDLAFPVVYAEGDWMLNGWYGEQSYDNPNPPILDIGGTGVLIGTLRRIDGTEICRVSILVFGGSM